MSGMSNPWGATAAPPAGDAKPVFGSNGPVTAPADPNYEPIDKADFLEKEGYFKLKVVREKAVPEGVWLTCEVQDEDFAGKRLQMRLDDFIAEPKSIWKWRNLAISVTGNKEAAKAPVVYNPGQFVGMVFYAKTNSYQGKNGPATGIMGDPVTSADYDTAVKAGKHRWPVKLEGPSTGNAFGAPAGLPTGGGFSVPQPQTTQPIATTPAPTSTVPNGQTAPAPTAPAPAAAPPSPFGAFGGR